MIPFERLSSFATQTLGTHQAPRRTDPFRSPGTRAHGRRRRQARDAARGDRRGTHRHAGGDAARASPAARRAKATCSAWRASPPSRRRNARPSSFRWRTRSRSRASPWISRSIARQPAVEIIDARRMPGTDRRGDGSAQRRGRRPADDLRHAQGRRPGDDALRMSCCLEKRGGRSGTYRRSAGNASIAQRRKKSTRADGRINSFHSDRDFPG